MTKQCSVLPGASTPQIPCTNVMLVGIVIYLATNELWVCCNSSVGVKILHVK